MGINCHCRGVVIVIKWVIKRCFLGGGGVIGDNVIIDEISGGFVGGK